MRPAHHAAIALLADKVVGFDHSQTVARLKELPILLRTTVELIVRKATGGDEGREHWPHALWRIREMVASAITMSPSGLTAADIRLGYDDYLHAVVDAVYDRWETLIS